MPQAQSTSNEFLPSTVTINNNITAHRISKNTADYNNTIKRQKRNKSWLHLWLRLGGTGNNVREKMKRFLEDIDRSFYV
jgi:hypothetical protein